MSFDKSNFLLKGESASGSQSAQNRLQDEATEHTIAGSLIGAVRDVIPGLHGTAQSNDQIAHIAADTVASLPMVKTVTGGAIRAVMLIDPTKSAESNAAYFSLNFVEGAALNKVSKMAMPDSGFSQLLSSKLGTGLTSEAATHLTVGLGFGAIRTGFNPDSWKDGQGNFSLATGAENLVKGSATGALVNLPAGMIGFRVARASSLALENSALSPRMASVLSGVGSGYAAGGVFGGVDAVLAGKSFTDVLKGVNEGGIIGAATGGFMGSFDPARLVNSTAPKNFGGTETVKTTPFEGPLVSRESAVNASAAAGPTELVRPVTAKPEAVKPEAVKPEAVKPEAAAVNGDQHLQAIKSKSDAVEPRDANPRDKIAYPANDEHFVLGEGQYEALTIKPFEIPRVEDVQHRLTSFQVKPETYRTFDPESKGPWKDSTDFANSSLKTAQQDFRIYKVDGGKTEIAVPESYARQLDEVRALRIKAEKPSVLDDLPPGHHLSVQQMVKDNNTGLFRSYFNAEETQQVLPVIWARIKLGEHPLGNRALPEDFVSLMDELPTTNNIKRLTIWDSRSPYDNWFAQEHSTPNFKAAATATESEGKMDFFQTERADRVHSPFRGVVRGSIFHEHGHLVPPRDNLYDTASLLEKEGFYPTAYSKMNNSERWAEDRSKAFLHPDVDKFLEFAQEAPVRSAVIAHELRQQLEAVPPEQQSVYAQQMWDRVKFTEQQVLPYARQEMVAQLGAKDVEVQSGAIRLLERFGTKSDSEALMQAAATAKDQNVRRRAFDVAIQLHSRDPVEQFEYVWKQGVENPKVSDLAETRLRYYGLVDERASSYARLLHHVRKNDLAGLAIQVTRMQTNEGANLAYDFAMNMGRHVQGYQRAVALSALEEVPSLRLRALNTLANQQPEYIAPVVRKFINDSDPEVAQSARDVLKGVELRSNIQEVNDVLDHGGAVKPNVVEALGNSGDSKAIPSLLQIMTRGPESTRALAVDELAKFDPNIIRFYARLARKDLTIDQARRLDLITNYNFKQRTQSHASE
ncbi:MAG: HEAT repeat domain-containing protein [Candidatus Melainabacteria bacterium]|nr:MAG: HEAT repeat domain-containing protein [Candidatus Melainabacteria bacterium]